jgi:ABC-2 type transport system permease protein
MNINFYGIIFYTLLRKEILRFMRIWPQTLLPPAITTSLYFVIFGQFIGAQLSDIHGYNYMQYIAPGLIMMTVITNSYANVSTSFFISRFQKSIEEQLVAPIPEAMMLLGYTAGGVLRGIAVGIVVAAIALCFTHLQLQHPITALLTLILCSLLFSLAGFMNAIFARKFDDISLIPTFVLTPLTYLGGVFYSLTMLPSFWQKISLANPVLYMVDSFRYSILGVSDIKLSHAWTMIGFFIIGLFIYNWYLLKKGIGIRN